MAHFAQIDKETKVVLNVIKIDDNILTNNGSESEEIEGLGLDYISQLYQDSENYIWKQTSINDRIRGCYATLGGTYDEDLDIFKPIKWNYSWIWNNEKFEWESPIPQPDITEQEIIDGYYYIWDDELYQSDNTKGWVKIQYEEPQPLEFEPLPE